MSRVLLVERSPFGALVALVEDGRLMELQGAARGTSQVGRIFKGRVARVVPAINAAFVEVGDGRNAFLFADDVQTSEPVADRAIADLVEPGERLLVQVVKDALPGKGPRVTTQIALPGRFLVLLPTGGGGGISRRIAEPEARERAERLVEAMRPEGAGLIFRTVAAEASEAALRGDLEELVDRWSEIERRAVEVKAPALVYRDLDPVLRTVRDRLDREVETVWVEGDEAFREVVEYVGASDPELADRVRLEPDEGLLFERFGIDRELRAALDPRVALPSGGHLVIEPTEAMVVVDVNSGSSVGGASLEETALATNLEAAVELGRQARLRDLAGLIVVDFIDMESAESRERLVREFERVLADDPARTQVAEVSDFGLVSLTRKRDRASLYRRMGRPCPTCGGRGYLEALEAGRDAVWRRVLSVAHGHRDGVVLRLDPELRRFMDEEAPSAAELLHERLGDRLSIEEEPDLSPGEFTVVRGAGA